jgi:hypothetical protein
MDPPGCRGGGARQDGGDCAGWKGKTMNPRIRTASMTNTDFHSLFCAIRETTGLLYGYHPIEMADTAVIEAILTLCGRKSIGKALREKVEAVIVAWGIGSGRGIISVRWA